MRIHRPAAPSDEAPAWLAFVAGGTSRALEDLSPADWTAALTIAERGGVLPALAARLRATGASRLLPDALQPRLDDVERSTAVSTLSNQRAFVQVARALDSIGVPVVPYKGIDLAHAVYPEPGMRPMKDVDLWVRAEELPTAMEALACVGIVERHTSQRVARYERAWDGEAQLQRRDGQPFGAELHLGPFPGEWLHRAARIDRAAVWGRLQPGELLGHGVRRLANEDHALEVALHAVINEQLTRVQLRQLLDLTMLVRAGLDADALVERARDWRVARATGFACTLAGALYADETVAALGERLMARAPRGLLPRHWGLPTTGSLLRGEHLSDRQHARFVYQLRVADDAAAVVRLGTHGLWPDADWLEARYGASDARTRWRHLVWLAHPRRTPPTGDR